MAKPTSDIDDGLNVGHLRDWFPDPAALLEFQQQPLQAVKDDCIFVLDANILLLPYASSSKPLAEISQLFENLVRQGRLFVPAQAMREFLGQRAKKLGEIAKQLVDFQSQLTIPALPRIPLLLDEPEYQEALATTKVAGDFQKAKEAVSAVIERLRGPIGSDPVSLAYQRLFPSVLLEETEEHFAQAAAEAKLRYSQKRPPGFSDASKPDGGIGDLLIWRSLLRLAQERRSHCVFVSSDRKADWWVQANGAFQPRLELIEEFRVASGGKTLHLALLGDALELVGASSNTVDEVRAIEHPPIDQLEMWEIVTRAQKLQSASFSAKPASYYYGKALELDKKIAEGRGVEGDEVASDRYLSIAHHIERKVQEAGAELAAMEAHLAARGASFARDGDTGQICGIAFK